MKKIIIILITFVLISIINGNANETVPIKLVSFSNSSSVGEIQKVEANTNSASELEPITMLILGTGLIILGTFIRKKLLYRGSLTWLIDYDTITEGDD